MTYAVFKKCGLYSKRFWYRMLLISKFNNNHNPHILLNGIFIPISNLFHGLANEKEIRQFEIVPSLFYLCSTYVRYAVT